jgi:hypothetical protein
MNTFWGPARLVPPGWDPDAEDAYDAIEHKSEYTRSHLEVAVELWALVDAARAQRIEGLVLRAFGRDPHVLHIEEIAELGHELDGLETRLRDAGWIDANEDVPADRLPELARRTVRLPLGGDAVPRAAISSGISRVDAVRALVARALAGGFEILFD